MSARSAVLISYDAAGPIRVRVGSTTRTFTEGQYERLMALLNEGAVDVQSLSGLRRGRPLQVLSAGTSAQPQTSRASWEVADRIVPALIWIVGLLFAAAALPL